MKYFKKAGVFLVTFIFIFQSINIPVYAMSTDKPIEIADSKKATILLDDNMDNASLFMEESESSEVLSLLYANDEVIILEELEDFFFVEYVKRADKTDLLQGFIRKDLIQINEDEHLDKEYEEEVEEDKGEESDNINHNNSNNNETDGQNDEDTEDILVDKPIKEAESDEAVDTEVETEDVLEPEDEVKNTNDNIEENTSENQQTFSVKGNSQQSIFGIAIKEKANVYKTQSTSSTKLKSYAQGSILQYKPLNTNWYEATVMYSGKWTIGYIHKNDVENTITNQVDISGIGLQNPTKVYSRASTEAKALKSYAEGSILKYKTFANNWYEATVYINGKATTGYIHKPDTETILSEHESLEGVGTKKVTTVYSRASTNGPKLKSYSQGSILKYKEFSDNWYVATVYLKGKATTGYIHKSHVENIVNKQEPLSGIGLEIPTNVYSKASTNSKKLKSYSQGTILKYNTFSNNWYEASVYINGKKTTGYIHSSHVENTFKKSQALDGMSLNSPTKIFSKASRQAKVLKTYPKAKYLVFKTLSPNWYEASVILNGKRTTGYIHRNDVSTDKVSMKTTSYSTDFKKVVDIQMTKNPQTSGKSGGWANASKQQVEYYVNSSNFSKNSTEYFQFLVLSQSADLDEKEVNKKILPNHGSLTNQAEAFITAGKKFNINEAYLISHALLETGNGTSTLAKGVPVDNKGNIVAANKASHTVYNMYGIGAIDSSPIPAGAKRAFEEGWFTPRAAIIGGAEFINTYIARGQDTLYKIRWNPISPGYPQYATDVAWATKQTTNIKRIYDLLDRYVLIYDVPKYVGQPSSSGNPNSNNTNNKTYLEVIATSVNVRKGAGTSYGSIGGVKNGDLLTPVLDKNGNLIKKTADNHVWFQIEYNNSIAWVSGGVNGTQYIKILK